jgi:hypothetical protein
VGLSVTRKIFESWAIVIENRFGRDDLLQPGDAVIRGAVRTHRQSQIGNLHGPDEVIVDRNLGSLAGRGLDYERDRGRVELAEREVVFRGTTEVAWKMTFGIRSKTDDRRARVKGLGDRVVAAFRLVAFAGAVPRDQKHGTVVPAIVESGLVQNLGIVSEGTFAQNLPDERNEFGGVRRDRDNRRGPA